MVSWREGKTKSGHLGPGVLTTVEKIAVTDTSGDSVCGSGDGVCPWGIARNLSPPEKYASILNICQYS